MSKDQVQSELLKNTQNLEKISLSEALTTESISDAVSIRRNTTSQYLNELVKSNIAIKVKTRPAIFLSERRLRKNFLFLQNKCMKTLIS